MATTKKSRMKFLPPRIQLDERSAMTGSFPTVARFSTDGRTGIYPVAYDDTKTINFVQKSVGNFYEFLELRDDILFYVRPDLEGGSSTPPLTFFMLPSYIKAVDDLHASFISVNHQGDVFGSPPSPTPGRVFRYGASNDHTLITDDSGHDILNFFDKALPDEFTTPFSVSIHVRTDSIDNVGKTIVSIARSSQYDSVTTRVFQITFNPTTNIVSVFANMDGASMSCVMSSNQFTPVFTSIPGMSFWIHFSYDGSNTIGGMKLYVTEDFYGTTNEFHTNKSIAQVPVSLGTGDCIGVLGKFSPSFGGSWSGEIDQFCIFDKALTQQEFNLLSTAGTVSYVADASGVYLGTGLPFDSPFLSTDPKHLENETTTLVGTANIVKGIGDSTPMVHFTPGQDGGPFRDNDQYAVDGKSDNDPFFATGTSVEDGGEGFESPLWSKNKIEIDIGCASTSNISTFIERNNTPIVDSSYNMCYYNFVAKRWEGVGVGRWQDSGTVNFANTYNMAGFIGGLIDRPDFTAAPLRPLGLIDKLFECQINAGRISDIYGFPFDARYHATSSQLFPMSTVINKPFLVEKIVINLSASFIFDSNIQNGQLPSTTQYELTSSFFPGAINNVFILNQRKNVRLNYYNTNYEPNNRGLISSSIPTNVRLSNVSNPAVRVDTIRDIVTYGGVSSFASNVKTFVTRSADVIFGSIPYRAENPKELFSRDIVIDTGIPLSKSLNALNWDARLEFKLKPKCPFYLTASLLDGESRAVFGATGGGSNNLGVLFPSGRNQGNFIKQVTVTEEIPSLKYVTGDFDSNTPYILYPEDNLIIGWQKPTPSVLDDWQDITTGTGLAGSVPGTGRLSRISFAQGPAKVVLYGSYITEGVENNDSLNQLLSSESIHEIIGED